jgi:hypothetical protein
MTTFKIENLKKHYLKHLTDKDVNNNKQKREELNKLISKLSAIKINDPGEFRNYLNLRCLYNFYLEELIIKLKQESRTIEKILVFESPPESGRHFLTHGGNYYYCFFDQEQKVDEVLLKRFQIYCNNFKQKGRGRPIKKLKEGEQKQFIKRLSTVLSSNIVYIDLFLLPIDLKDARKKWCKHKDFKDENDKRLTVWIFEWAMKNLKEKLNNNGCGIASPFNINCKIAFGTPINTSISIFEYYRDKLFDLDIGIKLDLTIPNSPNSFLKQGLEGTTFPMFKFNIVNSGGSPSRELVKNAFNL